MMKHLFFWTVTIHNMETKEILSFPNQSSSYDARQKNCLA